jgi:hypothetical protein
MADLAVLPRDTRRVEIVVAARLERVFVLVGLAVVPLLFISMLLAGTFPPWDPSWAPEKVVQVLTSEKTRTGVGFMIHTAGVSLFALWGAAVTVSIYRMEAGRRLPILAVAQGILAGGNVVYFELIPLVWSSAQYRAGEVAPEITMSFTDFGWFLYLGTWAPFSLQAIVIAIAVLEDQKRKRVFTHGRLVAFWSFAFATVGLFSAPMGLFKSGPFAWDGLLAFWVVVVTWGFWELTLTWQMHAAIGRDEKRKLAALEADGGAGV